MMNEMVQNRDSPDCVKIGYQGEFPGFEVGNSTVAVLVAHKGLLGVHTCSYSHVGPSTKDVVDSGLPPALGLTGGGEMVLQPTVMSPPALTLDDMDNVASECWLTAPLCEDSSCAEVLEIASRWLMRVVMGVL